MAVYTELSEAEIGALLGAYDLPALARADGIRAGVSNTNYLLTLEGGRKLILTLFEKRTNERELPFFTELMERLSAKGVPCPMPLKAKDGKATQHIKDKPALLVSFLEGKSTLSITPLHMSELGGHMARMHLVGQGFERARMNTMGRGGWRDLFDKIGNRADEIMPGLAREVAEEIEALEKLWPNDLPQGVIHGDLFPDNVFFDDAGKLTGIIDFYFACDDYLALDLAICLNAWCFEKTYEFNITRAKLMLRAYNDVRPISERELEVLPVLARGAALRFLLTRARDALFPVEAALVTPKDPMEYVKKLRFHRSVTHHKEYGL